MKEINVLIRKAMRKLISVQSEELTKKQCLANQKPGPKRNQIGQYLDLWLPASRAMKSKFLQFNPPSFVYNGLN